MNIQLTQTVVFTAIEIILSLYFRLYAWLMENCSLSNGWLVLINLLLTISYEYEINNNNK